MNGWNFADVWEHNADRFPSAVAQVQGDRVSTWAEFDRRGDGIAAQRSANVPWKTTASASALFHR